MIPPNPGKGYRLLRKGEAIHPFDQIWDERRHFWYVSTCPRYGVFYRRKLKPKAKHGPAKSKM